MVIAIAGLVLGQKAAEGELVGQIAGLVGQAGAQTFEYLEEKHLRPPLIGTTAEERAETRMWQRRIELNVTEHLYNGFRWAEGIEMFRPRMRVVPEAADGLKAIVRDKLAWLDGLLPGRQYVVGSRFAIADIILYVALDFGATVGQVPAPALRNLGSWLARVGARPSVERSLHPAAAGLGMRR
jgi:glutathione S-transferase